MFANTLFVLISFQLRGGEETSLTTFVLKQCENLVNQNLHFSVTAKSKSQMTETRPTLHKSGKSTMAHYDVSSRAVNPLTFAGAEGTEASAAPRL